MKIGILTSGGDCAGLNSVMRGIGLYVYQNIKNAEIVGIPDGYSGLIRGECRPMPREEFERLLDVGGTVLGSVRTPFKMMTVPEEDGSTRLEKMCVNYRKMGLDCLFTLGGAGTHRTAALLCAEGYNVIGLPKTIDNDIYGTDYTFGFHTALDVVTDAIERVRTTADSHGRTILVEVMGNKAGWLTLFSGIAGGADAIILPEIPFNIDKIVECVKNTYASGKRSCVIAIAEGAVLDSEAPFKRRERAFIRLDRGEATATRHLAEIVGERTGAETRGTVLGYIQRGGRPSAYDKVFSTRLGSYAGKLAAEGRFGVTVALVGNQITFNALADIAGKYKLVDPESEVVKAAEGIGICLGR